MKFLRWLILILLISFSLNFIIGSRNNLFPYANSPWTYLVVCLLVIQQSSKERKGRTA